MMVLVDVVIKRLSVVCIVMKIFSISMVKISNQVFLSKGNPCLKVPLYLFIENILIARNDTNYFVLWARTFRVTVCQTLKYKG